MLASLRHYVAKIGLKIAQHVSYTTKRKAKQMSKGKRRKDKSKNKNKSSDNQRCRRRRLPLLLAKYLANK